MSYILEALKKAQAERAHGAALVTFWRLGGGPASP